jgi:hypothetical protein
MENIHIIRVYNLVNPKGKRLQLRLGYIRKFNDIPTDGDTGYRWSFLGREIPMPVRNGTWFNGFPEATMLLWLAEQEWCVETKVDMATGKATTYALPEPAEEYSAREMADDGVVFNALIKELNAQNRFGVAMQLYSYACEVGHQTAREAVRAICEA